MSRVLIVGGGAAGMMAALSAAGKGHCVTVFEKNEKLGKKIYITGKGRCNAVSYTHLSDGVTEVILKKHSWNVLRWKLK